MTLSPTLTKAIEIAARRYPGFDLKAFRTVSRERKYSEPRQYVWTLLVTNANMSLTQIGRLSGGYHHTTILFATTKFHRLLGREYFYQFAAELKGNQMNIEAQIAWAKKDYHRVAQEPRYMADRYYELAMTLEVERQALIARTDMLIRRLKALGGTDELPPVKYSYENTEEV